MLRWKPVAVLGVASVIAAGPVAQHATPDAVLANGYGSALAEAETSWTSIPHNIWLSALSGGSAAPEKPLAAGDTITIAAKDGRPQVIEVTGLELIDGDLIGAPGLRFQLVTGRAVGRSGAPVRFLFATETQPPAPLPTAADRVL
jgi:hypothetical protein